MLFFRPIWFGQYHGVEVARVDVPLTVLSATGEVDQGFRFDTGAYITTVSEDVAAACGLPAGGTLIHVRRSRRAGSGSIGRCPFSIPA